MQILQHEEHRREVRQIGQQPGDALEQPQPVTHGVRPAPQQPVDHGMSPENVREPLVTGERPEHLGERQIRQPDITEIDTVPGQHGHARRGGPARDLVQYPGPADSGVPGDQHGPGLTTPGTFQHIAEPGKLAFPPDDRRTR